MITKDWILEHRNTAVGRLVADLLNLGPDHARLHVQFIADDNYTSDEAKAFTKQASEFAEELGFEVGVSTKLPDGFSVYTLPRLRLQTRAEGDVWWVAAAEDYDLGRLLSEYDVAKLSCPWRVVRGDDSVVVDHFTHEETK